MKKTGLTHDQLVRAYRVLAVTYAVLDKEEQARDAFLQLLTYDAGLPGRSEPRPQGEHAVHGGARQLPLAPVEARHRGRPRRVSTNGGTLRVTTRDPTRIVKKVIVGYRWTSSGEYTVSQINPGEVVAPSRSPPLPPAARDSTSTCRRSTSARTRSSRPATRTSRRAPSPRPAPAMAGGGGKRQQVGGRLGLLEPDLLDHRRRRGRRRRHRALLRAPPSGSAVERGALAGHPLRRRPLQLSFRLRAPGTSPVQKSPTSRTSCPGRRC